MSFRKKFKSGSEFTEWFLEHFEDEESHDFLLLTVRIADVLIIISRAGCRSCSSQFKTACSQCIFTNEHSLFYHSLSLFAVGGTSGTA